MRNPPIDRYSSNPSADAFWNAAVRSRLSLLEGASALSPPSIVADAQHSLDCELAAMQRAMSPIRTRRNALATVSRLPPEILTRILAFVRTHDPPRRFFEFETKKRKLHLGWITTTHVCRHWRDTAVGSPSLWDQVDFAIGDQWAEEILLRTKTVPISVHHTDGPWKQRHVELIAHHLPHIKNLSLHDRQSMSDEITSELYRVLMAPAPLLETISFLILKDTGASPSPTTFSPAPRLRRGVFHSSVHFPWASPVLANLVSLDIGLFETRQPPAPPSLDEILNSLARMPGLVTLGLARCLPRASDLSKDYHHPGVSLPHLVRLVMDGPISDCAAILKYVTLPSTATLHLTLACSAPAGAAAVRDFFPVLSGHLGIERSTFAKLSFTNDEQSPELVDINAWASLPPLDAATRETPSLSLSFTLDPAVMKALDVPPAFCAALPAGVKSVRSLDVDVTTETEWSSQDWLDIFAHMDGVREVFASSEAAVHLCEALGMSVERTGMVDWQSPSGEDIEDGRVFFLPRLLTLTLEAVDFSNEFSWPPVGEPWALRRLLPIWLRARKGGNSPLNTLCLRSCLVSLEAQRELEGVVPRVYRE